MALEDEDFTLEYENKLKLPSLNGVVLTVRHDATAARGNWVNLEFGTDDSDRILIDWYGDPEDLDRLGVLLQYVAKQALDKQKETEQKR